ncbi:hypothetical protein GIB67_013441 [Kingdonia uniflora]|uniref:Pollen Ole e 1 allergen and extensin family protein n=1 Tax=Kingdonia uniflora TaxID=39325 RepID=A0A7J7LRA9_9MAGN|nr:hypothetical protein GIB67_013441 [Kingdonia uniflora]
MGSFYGCFSLMLFFFLALPSIARRENQSIDLSGREEFVEMAGYGEEKLSSVVVTGTVLCETRLDSEVCALPVSGATMAVSCKISRKSMKSSWAKTKTDEYGEFIIDLPSHLHALTDLHKKCSVRVLRLPKKSPCSHAFIRQQRKLKLSSVGNNIRAYMTDDIKFQSPYTD